MDNTPVLDVRNLKATLRSRRGEFDVLDGVSFTVNKGEILGLVGESGSGKSMTCNAIMGLLPRTVDITQGQIFFEGDDLLSQPAKATEKLRGSEIAMILQDPMASLNPSLRIGFQVGEPLAIHKRMRGATLRNKVVDLLFRVGISDPSKRASAYPHEMSGGMRQRVVGAAAISCNPKVLIADEPTTALDVTVQAQYIELMLEIRRELGVAIVVVTHDLGIVAKMCDSVAVMYGGRIVERGSVRDIFNNPRHPYTRGLLSCIPSVDSDNARLATIEGQPPDPANLPPGCAFAPRCPMASAKCLEQIPEVVSDEDGRAVACWNAA
jgi:oligopeptide/dipeptide ABC transporter ATP-binding protein